MIPIISGQVVQLDQKRNHAFKIKVSFQFINKRKKKIYIIFYQSVLWFEKFLFSVIAELWALRDGLNLPLSEGIRNLIVELDTRVVIDLIKSNAASSKLYSLLLCDCRCLLRGFHRVQVQHVFREGNCPSDALARWGCLINDTFVVFNHPQSADILGLINSDLAGKCNVRIVRTICNGLTSGVG